MRTITYAEVNAQVCLRLFMGVARIGIHHGESDINEENEYSSHNFLTGNWWGFRSEMFLHIMAFIDKH